MRCRLARSASTLLWQHASPGVDTSSAGRACCTTCHSVTRAGPSAPSAMRPFTPVTWRGKWEINKALWADSNVRDSSRRGLTRKTLEPSHRGTLIYFGLVRFLWQLLLTIGFLLQCCCYGDQAVCGWWCNHHASDAEGEGGSGGHAKLSVGEGGGACSLWRWETGTSLYMKEFVAFFQAPWSSKWLINNNSIE